MENFNNEDEKKEENKDKKKNNENEENIIKETFEEDIEKYLPNPELKKNTLLEGKEWTQELLKLPPELRDLLKERLEGEKEKDYSLIQNKKPEDMSPAEAQRSTFYLIDTVKQLTETLSNMQPVLTQGKDIIQSLKSLDKMM